MFKMRNVRYYQNLENVTIKESTPMDLLFFYSEISLRILQLQNITKGLK